MNACTACARARLTCSVAGGRWGSKAKYRREDVVVRHERRGDEREFVVLLQQSLQNLPHFTQLAQNQVVREVKFLEVIVCQLLRR